MWELIRKYRRYLFIGIVLLVAFVFYSLNLKDKEHENLFERGVLNLMSPVNRVISRINNGAGGDMG
jgi:hypothetical protein